MNGCSKRQNVVYIIILGAIILFCFSTMLYSDNIINSNIGYSFINSILQGKFKEFYNGMDWSYGMTIYSIYAVWSLPVWIISHIMQIEVNMMSIPVLLWYKLLLVVFAIFSVWILGKISEEIYKEYKWDIQFHYMSSILFVMPIFAIAQCDIIGLCFVLLGIYFYIQNKNIKFLVCFAIAITMKYFALFVFIPLVLFKYRKISKVFSVLVAGLVLMLISFVLISNSDKGNAMLHSETYYVNRHIESFSKISLPIGEERNIGLFAFSYMLLCIAAYMVPNKNQEKNEHYIVWMAFAGYMCLFLFYPCNIYWFVLLAPFLIMVSYFKKENLTINLLLETAFNLLIVVYYSYNQDWVLLGAGTYKYLFFKGLGQAVENNSIKYFIETVFHLDLGVYMPLVLGIIYACGIALIIINFPGINVKQEEQKDEDILQEIKVITWLRLGILGALIAISIYCLLASQDDYYFQESAVAQIVDKQIQEDHCKLQGDLFFDDDGAWMNEECTLMINTDKDFNQDLNLSIYGYTVTGEDTVEVYVNSQYIGDLQKEEAEVNITNRYIVIQNQYLSKEKVQQTVLLKAKPHVVTVENAERPISVYIQSVSVETVK